jgi:hypothetical protein
MATDYSKYGLTYADPVAAQYRQDGEGNGETLLSAARDAGYTDSKGNFYTVDQASSLISGVQKGDYTAAGGNADMYVDYNALKDDPAKVTGALTRAQWDDYVARFLGSEEKLMGMSIYGTSDNGKAMIEKEINDAVGAGGYVSKSLAASRGQSARGMQRFGMAPTVEQKAAVEATTAIDESLAKVDASNRIRESVVDRSNAIATGATPNAGRGYGLRSE